MDMDIKRLARLAKLKFTLKRKKNMRLRWPASWQWWKNCLIWMHPVR